MVDPKIMCDRHLLGEHVECHMFAGCIERNKSLDGYIRNNLLDVSKLSDRHHALSEEMLSRGFKHKSPLATYLGRSSPIDAAKSLNDLIHRCTRCRDRFHRKP
jgi:hypothetical protein